MGYTTEGFEEEIKAKQNLMEALQCQHTGEISGFLVKRGSSKFFHNCAKIKRAKSFIHALSIDDVLVEDKQAIAEWWTITKGYTLLPILVFLLLTCLLLFLLWSQRVIMVILLQSLLFKLL